jgi:hypothetical protein
MCRFSKVVAVLVRLSELVNGSSQEHTRWLSAVAAAQAAVQVHQ